MPRASVYALLDDLQQDSTKNRIKGIATSGKRIPTK
jgi:hypothetical protein